jgi:hypothetical protein
MCRPSAALAAKPGTDGVPVTMTKRAGQMSSDLQFEILSGVCDGRTLAFESICCAINTGAVGPFPPPARSFDFAFASVGEVSEQRPGTSPTGLMGFLRFARSARRHQFRPTSCRPVSRLIKSGA